MLPRSLLALALGATAATALDNGLGLRPQRGWNTWNKYGTEIDAEIVLRNARALVDEGLHELGYDYLVIDDAWQGGRNASTGKLYEDEQRFPGGMKNLTAQVAALGLKPGIYSSAGTMTCGRRVGSLDYEKSDAQSFADWGFEYLKYDNCYNLGRQGTPKLSFDRYNAMTTALNETGKQIFYSMCNWGEDWPWLFAPTIANSYRVTGDIYDSFDRPDARCPCTDASNCNLQGFHCSVKNILGQVKSLGQKVIPGSWLDLDMLEVGNGGMTTGEYVVHMSMWAMMKSSLILGNDLSNMTNATRAIIKNIQVLDLVHADPMASAAYPVLEQDDGELQVWFSSLANDSYAVAFVNWHAEPKTMSIAFDNLFIDDKQARNATFDVYDLWQGVNFDTAYVPTNRSEQRLQSGSPASGSLSDVQIEGHGVRLLRLVPSGAEP